MRTFLTLAVYLTLTTLAAAQSADAVITGPTGGRPGDLLVLDAGNSTADYFAWSVEPELPNERPTILPIEDGKKCIICSVPGRYVVVLAVSNSLGIDQLKWTVTVGDGPVPPPGPGPSPGPGPTPPPLPVPPVIPDGQFAIARVAYDAAMSVESTSRAAEAQALAAGLDGVAASISAGVLSGAQKILAAILQANNAALGANMPKWVGWGAAVSERLKAIYLAGLLKSTDDWAACLREVSIGLKAVQ